MTFSAGVQSVDDQMVVMDDGNIWGRLSITFKPQSPQRLPAEVTNGS